MSTSRFFQLLALATLGWSAVSFGANPQLVNAVRVTNEAAQECEIGRFDVAGRYLAQLSNILERFRFDRNLAAANQSVETVQRRIADRFLDWNQKNSFAQVRLRQVRNLIVTSNTYDGIPNGPGEGKFAVCDYEAIDEGRVPGTNPAVAAMTEELYQAMFGRLSRPEYQNRDCYNYRKIFRFKADGYRDVALELAGSPEFNFQQRTAVAILDDLYHFVLRRNEINPVTGHYFDRAGAGYVGQIQRGQTLDVVNTLVTSREFFGNHDFNWRVVIPRNNWRD